MPIKFQALGGSGGLDLLLKIAPNVSVTLSKKESVYTKTLTTDENGQALFKCLPNGKYIATAQGSDGTKYQKEILIDDVQEECFSVTKVKDLPLKSKIKLSSGKKFILQAKNAYKHPTNSVTLVGEYIAEKFKWEERLNGIYLDYGENKELQALLTKLFNQLTAYERESILTFNAEYSQVYGVDPIPQHFYLLSYFELGIDEYGSPTEVGTTDGKKNLGFTSDASRIQKYEDGKVSKYFLRSSYVSGPLLTIYYIDEKGKIISDNMNDYDSLTYGILLACDISQNAKVVMDTDGYYKLKNEY